MTWVLTKLRHGQLLSVLFLGTIVCILSLALFLFFPRSDLLAAGDDDWPAWRHDAARSAATVQTLPPRLELQWTRKLPPQVTAWKDEANMMFDRSYEPIVAGGLVFLGSTVNDSVTAYDLETGSQTWRFYTGGPVRFAPVVWQEKLYVGSDDGRLYCLDTATGKLRWSVAGGPSDRRMIGNERLISTWPVRGGPVAADGRVYFAVGVWPFMGTFVYAVDAETGRVVWCNDSTSFTFRALPHPGAAGFSGLSPQGYLAIAGDRLIVPGSRGAPAVFDRADGRFLFYAPGSGPVVSVQGDLGFAGGQVFDVRKGWSVHLGGVSRVSQPVLADDGWYSHEATLDPATLELKETAVKSKSRDDKDQVAEDRLNEAEEKHLPTATKEDLALIEKESPREKKPAVAVKTPKPAAKPAAKPPTPAPKDTTPPIYIYSASIDRSRAAGGTPWLLAGSHLVVGDRGALRLIDVSNKAAPVKGWHKPLEEKIGSVVAARGKLLVATLEGSLYCFGAGNDQAAVHELPRAAKPSPGAWSDRAGEILRAAGAAEGYAIVWGLKDGGLVEELARQSRLHVVAVDRDEKKIDALRRRLDEAGLYGSRASVIAADPAVLTLAPYMASLMTSEDPAAAGLVKGGESLAKAFSALRPYGGTLCLALGADEEAAFSKGIEVAKLPGAETKAAGGLTLLVRAGPLQGSADWCGQNADAGNTRSSQDRLVMAPLGVLWYGNAMGNALVLPRHGEGPVEQVVGGRLFIEGPESLSCTDAYTGRLLWTRKFPGLGKYFDTTKHQLGAHALGSNFYAVADAVYVAHGDACHRLDPATGRTVKTFTLPEKPTWHFLLVSEDVLFAGLDPVIVGTKSVSKGKLRPPLYNKPAMSKSLVALDRHTGQVLWPKQAAEGFPHNGIAAGNGKLFAIDGRQILAMDARSGKPVWKSDECVGPGLSYSAQHDVLISAGALRGRDGCVLWSQVVRVKEKEKEKKKDKDKEESSTAKSPQPKTHLASAKLLWDGKWGPILCGDRIITQDGLAFDLSTGRQHARSDEEAEPHAWRVRRSHGCSPMVGSTHLLTMRSGDAGFFDLRNNGGTGNLGGFRSGCTPNLIVADGLLNAPDYTRTCTCFYQNRSSLACVPMDEVEYWTFGAPPSPGRVAFNFGAPGDRRAADGTLWWAHPIPYGPPYADHVPAAVTPKDAAVFLHHVTWMKAKHELNWVAASGVTGLRRVAMPLVGIDAKKDLMLRLCFAEPEHTEPGRRVFSIKADGKTLVEDLDIVAAAGGPRRMLVRDVGPIRVKSPAAKGVSTLTLDFSAKTGEPLICGAAVIEAERIKQ